jgi:prepilin-type N-terminal cleavage/methylation domain-containing protein
MNLGQRGTFQKKTSGFGLVETIVAIAIFSVVAFSVYGGFFQVLNVLSVLKIKNLATNLANEQIEIVRNLPFDQVGIVGGLPEGKIPRTQNFLKEGNNFLITTSIQDIDDPADGQIGGSPNDLSPADYKMVEIKIRCVDCVYTQELVYYTYVSPQSLETMGQNGALFIKVFDASGQPISGANVNVLNEQGTSTIDIDEISDENGLFKIVNAPPDINAYEILVSKNNYSTERTYSFGDSENPNPDKPNATVVSGQVTELSFIIDRLAQINFNTIDRACVSIPNVSFNLSGAKNIGENVLKYNQNHTTGEAGNKNVSNLEWDNYSISILGESFVLAGSDYLLPIVLNPNDNLNAKLVLAPNDPNNFLVQVVDGQNNQPISNANVRIIGGGDDLLLLTGFGFELPENCLPAGQVLFQNLNSGNYSLEVSKDGYTTFNISNISIDENWQMYNVVLTP